MVEDWGMFLQRNVDKRMAVVRCFCSEWGTCRQLCGVVFPVAGTNCELLIDSRFLCVCVLGCRLCTSCLVLCMYWMCPSHELLCVSCDFSLFHRDGFSRECYW